MLTEAQNIGFAVPINIAKQVLPQLVEHGRVVRPWLGVAGQVVGEELREILNLPLVPGFLVEAIEPGSPAAQAGLRGGILPVTIAGEEFVFGGDIITAANEQTLDTPEKFAQFTRALQVGDTVRLTLYREGDIQTVELHLPERPILPGDVSPEHRRTIVPLHQRRHGVWWRRGP
jgi:S1-C subfamily serine protease